MSTQHTVDSQAQTSSVDRTNALVLVAISAVAHLFVLGGLAWASGMHPRTLWHHFGTGGFGMWVLLALLVLGWATALGWGLFRAARPRLSVAPFLIFPAAAVACAFYFERSIASHSLEVVLNSDLWSLVQLRILAEGVSEALVPRCFGLLVASVLLSTAASAVAAQSMTSSAAPSAAPAFRRMLLGGSVIVVTAAGCALGLDAPLGFAPFLTALSVVYSVLLLTLVGLALTDRSTPSSGVSSVYNTTALVVASQLCLIGFWAAAAHSVGFGAIGGEAVVDDRAAPLLAESLARANWSVSVLPWFSLLPFAFMLVVLAPMPRGTGTAAPRNWVGPMAAVACALVVVGGQQFTSIDVARCVTLHRAEASADHTMVSALAGKPMRWDSIGARLWAGKETLILRSEEQEEQNVGTTSALLEANCEQRLQPVRDPKLHGVQLVVDESLAARHLECLLVGVLGLKPLEHDTWQNREIEDNRPPLWILRWPQPPLPPEYEEIVTRVVELRMGAARRQKDMHLEMHPTHWKLNAPQGDVTLSGQSSERLAGLKKALDGRLAAVSVAADPNLPASDLLNAAATILASDSEPELWVGGYSEDPNYVDP